MKDAQERVFQLTYRHGNQLKTKNFNFPGDLKSATERARTHCDVMDYRFVHVAPFIVDLDEQERSKLADAAVA